YSPDYFDRAIAAESIRGSGVVDKERAGFGAPLVAIRELFPGREDELQDFGQKGPHLPVTLTLSEVETMPSGDRPQKRVLISLHDPTRRESVVVGGTRLPLAADFSAPMEILLKGRNELLWGLAGFFNARKRAEDSGIYLLEPYDPDRIPVILSHGLISVPIIWRDIIPEFLSEPELARRYQFMVFTYPSSYPIAESAKLMRDELQDLRERYDPDGNDPLSTNLVAMGHSMGGILTHLLVAEMGDLFWNEVSEVPIDELQVDDGRREFLRELAFFDVDPATQRVVFLSTPHRGADMATLGIANSVSRLATFPIQILDEATSFRNGPPIPGMKVDVQKKVTSVQSLRPDSAIAIALDKAPYKSGVVYHSIIGDRGKGDTPDSSDGVVDYWSSHQDGAASELIVPTDHGSYEDPGAIEELKRILREHAGI
ncbi:MAG: alpha/beta hydrolase, partial [Verrucomicrobiota bacterium]